MASVKHGLGRLVTDDTDHAIKRAEKVRSHMVAIL